MPRMVVVLDASEIQADWMFRGLAMRVLRFMSWHNYLKVVVPPGVVEELVANHARALKETDQKAATLNRERSRAGLPAFVPSGETVEYREFLESFLDDVVSGWEVPGWPEVSHRDLVGHSLSFLAPFDEKGRGYRDALIWATALEFADAGWEVVLATRDRDFDSGERGVLAPNLAGQVSSPDGSVVLTADMGSWLLAHFPWAPMAADAPVPSEWSLDEAAAIATQVDLDDYLMASDFLSSLWPDPAELGLPEDATDVVIDETDWRGPLLRLGFKHGPDGAVLAKYDFPVDVVVHATLPDTLARGPEWRVLSDGDGRVRAESRISMAAHIVLFGDNKQDWVEEVSFRPFAQQSRDQLVLFGDWEDDQTTPFKA